MSLSKTKSKIPTFKTIVSTIGSVATAAMVIRSVARDYLPPEFQNYMYLSVRKFINKFSTHLTMVIHESVDLQTNPIYKAAELYISSRMSTDIHRLKVTKSSNEKNIGVAMEVNEEFIDVYNEVTFTWLMNSKKCPERKCYNDEGTVQSVQSDIRSLELTFHQKHKDMVLNEYLPFILKHAEERNHERKVVKLFMFDGRSYSRCKWMSVNLDHPATFETLAMDADMKEMVMKDLDRFVERREYYKKVGKAWKRGYLLYGPPGTGKSSLIAAMANYLNFDIYDLELTDVKSNTELRMLLMATANRSILVVEDIDCSVELHDRLIARGDLKKKMNSTTENSTKSNQHVTLSGFLNFIDGLWSSCGDERIIIFTTNHKEKLDPALIRPGRMDVHIHMSYCTPCGFRLLVSNYLGITQHKLLEEIEEFIRNVEVTPAEVAEQLLKDDDPDIALGGLVEFIKSKKKDKDQTKGKTKEVIDLAANMNDKNQQEENKKTISISTS
uniref:AAA-ATPase At3g50940-like n=1 Tax=Erigeron canadensis TaxID=72917 RepID=UPI001CB9CB1A|nr:AAA-ATPase At3g50940-like [Erigeron canadensis]